MSRNLVSRVAKLEAARGVALPNGGLLVVEVKNGESEQEALKRKTSAPSLAVLTAAVRLRLNPVYLTELDLGAL